jgi:hypothetical protein
MRLDPLDLGRIQAAAFASCARETDHAVPPRSAGQRAPASPSGGHVRSIGG